MKNISTLLARFTLEFLFYLCCFFLVMLSLSTVTELLVCLHRRFVLDEIVFCFK